MSDSPHLKSLIHRYSALEVCVPDLLRAYDLLHEAFRNERKLLLCGNGGSAADSDHWAAELLKGFGHPRPLPHPLREGLSLECASRLQWAFSAIPLTGFSAFSTAFSNDVDPEYVFAQLVLALGRSGDVLVGMSTSGNSKNVCRAAEVARAKSLPVLALTGSEGGALLERADVCIRVPATQTPLIQEYHLPIYHCLSLMLEERFVEIWKCPASEVGAAGRGAMVSP